MPRDRLSRPLCDLTTLAPLKRLGTEEAVAAVRAIIPDSSHNVLHLRTQYFQCLSRFMEDPIMLLGLREHLAGKAYRCSQESGRSDILRRRRQGKPSPTRRAIRSSHSRTRH